MSDLRIDEWTGHAAILSPQRAARPRRTTRDNCPFCVGNELLTPPEILRHTDGHSWDLRVVPNKYPALDKTNGSPGVHEVLIECVEHDFLSWTQYSTEKIIQIFEAVQSRIKDLSSDPLIESIVVFKNQGRIAGATLDHPHTQILALPTIPPALERRSSEKNDCYLCNNLDKNPGQGVFRTFVPVAPRFINETWIVHRDHGTGMEDFSRDVLGCLADTLLKMQAGMERELGYFDHNYVFHNPPKKCRNGSWHWHMEVIPRLGTVGGFELGTGIYINQMSPR